MSAQFNPHAPEHDVPVAVPAGSDHGPGTAQVSGHFRATGVTTTPARPEPKRPNPSESPSRYGRAQLARRAADLSDRDRQVIDLIASHRFLTTAQLQRFVFTDHASAQTAERVCRRILTRLHRDHLIQPLERRVGGVRAGSSATVWQLAPAGARVAFDDGQRHRVREPSPRLRDHCLRVADAHLTVRDLTVLDQIDSTKVDLEPVCWRRYTGLGGDARWLQPDLHASVLSHDADGQLEDRWLIEIDLGTESLPTLIKKCRQYEDYRQSGLEQADGEGTFPLVLWVFHGPRASTRREQLERRIARDNRLTNELYRLCTPEQLLGLLVSGGAS